MHEPLNAGHRALGRWVLWLVMGITVAVSLAVASRRPLQPLFELGNLVGPTTESLLRGGGLTACTEAMGTPGNPICFHAGRMPMASMVVGAGIRVLGESARRVEVAKTLLFLVPIEAAIWLVWVRGLRRWLVAGLLLVPFGMPAFLADVVNLQVEEGYSYSLLALAVAMLLFEGQSGRRDWRRGVLFALIVDGIYLAKSSMVAAVAVLVWSYLVMEKDWGRRVLVVGLVVMAPVGWALHQHHASGRYSVGTSLDGINLHKANNEEFLELYPPPGGGTLDAHDRDLNAGLQFGDEWSFNDFHARAAIVYLRAHLLATAEGDLRKLWILFFSVRKFGSGESRGGTLVAETVGLVVFRLMLWGAMIGAVWTVVRPVRAIDRRAGAIFLAFVGAVAFPYVVGFAYTRHVSVLIYPSALMCCRLLKFGQDANTIEGMRK